MNNDGVKDMMYFADWWDLESELIELHLETQNQDAPERDGAKALSDTKKSGIYRRV